MTTPARRRGKHISGDFYSNFKRKAGYRNIAFEVTLQDLDDLMERQDFKCAYTNLPISADGYKKYTASLDRIDSSKGYTPDNVQFVYTPVNTMKHVLTDGDFLDIVEKIYQNRIAESNNVDKVSELAIQAQVS